MKWILFAFYFLMSGLGIYEAHLDNYAKATLYIQLATINLLVLTTVKN